MTASTLSSDEIDLKKLFGILRDGKWLILTVTTLSALFGVAVALLSTPVYRADALIQIEKKNSGSISSMVGDMGDLFAQESSATTESEIIKSRMILGTTVDKFNLTTVITPHYSPFIGKGIARLSGDVKNLSVSRYIVPNTQATTNSQLEVLDRKNQSFQLSSLDGKIILTGKVGELIKAQGYEIFVTSLDASEGSSFTLGEIGRLEAIENLKRTLSINELGTQTGVLKLAMEGENPVQTAEILNHIAQTYFLQNVERNSAEAQQSLEFLKGHLPDIKTNLTSAEDTLNRYRQKNESIDLGLEAQSTLKVMVELEAQLKELTFNESEISQRFTKDHPTYKSLLNKRQTLLKDKDRLNKQVQKLPETQREILRMTRDVEVNQQIYVQLLNKVQELSIIKASTVGNVRILDDAQTFSKAVKPKKRLIVVLATLLGVMFSVVIVLVKAAFHRGIEDPEEIEQLGLPVYASVPKSVDQLQLTQKQNRKRRVNKTSVPLAEHNPADLSIEALRGLRTSLHFAMLEAKNNVVMLSGPTPSVGKSFISSNFAAVVAKAGMKVLLIDADMRKGHLHKVFGLDEKNGLSDCLSGVSEFSQVVKVSELENLHLLTRGQVPPNPAELLMHQNFDALMKSVSSDYDLVVIDTPPILAVTDPSIVGVHAGTTLMVTRFGQCHIKEIEMANRRFERAGIDVKGVIFNAVEKRASSEHCYYNYSYSSDS
ncbi:polysaccharide biosynthesis tyrosine autokinase [Vibrio caribbeanicus]|uniref:polysaccharide biosynthesis tyrosine autokinase n=1 Tax=Vibrio caribbeanicus TaxID=701175 RepID=UPI003BB53942